MNNYEDLIGRKLDNRYELISIVGAGGMAVVYEAVDTEMDRKVAIKMLKGEIKEDEQEVKRFINESRVVAMLSHPNIVHIYDVSVKSIEKMYIVMEYIDGITLKDYINGKGRLQWREAIIYIEQVLYALQHAHDKSVIHRDVKPQNIMLLRNGNIKVTDFGIAKTPNSEPLTMTDKAIGTVHYISPEQASGEGRITNVSDIYSVGVMLYEMIAGKLPFTSDNAIQVAVMQVNDVPEDPRKLNPEIPKGLSQIILKAMSKNPAERYRSASEMAKQLSILASNPATVFPNTQTRAAAVVPVDKKKEDKQVVKPGAGVKERVQESNLQKNNGNEGEMRRNNRGRKKPGKVNRSFLPIASGVTVAFLIVLGISLYYILSLLIDGFIADSGETVEIGSYLGRNYKEVEEELDADKYNLIYDFVYNATVGSNKIVAQLPEPGEKRKISGEGDKVDITFTVSKGKDAFEMPDLSYYTFREAEILLEGLQLKVGLPVRESHDSILSGLVIRTEPEAGVIVDAGDEVMVYVSNGQEINKTIMPNLNGMTEKEAIKNIESVNLIYKESKYDYSHAPAGIVIDQDIKASLEVPEKSTKVTITVSLGPKPEPTTMPLPAQNNADGEIPIF